MPSLLVLPAKPAFGSDEALRSQSQLGIPKVERGHPGTNSLGADVAPLEQAIRTRGAAGLRDAPTRLEEVVRTMGAPGLQDARPQQGQASEAQGRAAEALGAASLEEQQEASSSPGQPDVPQGLADELGLSEGAGAPRAGEQALPEVGSQSPLIEPDVPKASGESPAQEPAMPDPIFETGAHGIPGLPRDGGSQASFDLPAYIRGLPHSQRDLLAKLKRGKWGPLGSNSNNLLQTMARRRRSDDKAADYQPLDNPQPAAQAPSQPDPWPKPEQPPAPTQPQSSPSRSRVQPPLSGDTWNERVRLWSARKARDNGEVSLFCWVLMKPGTYEFAVLSEQHLLRQGIFGCDHKAVYSNQSGFVGDGFALSVVEQSLETSHKYVWNITVNTDKFRAVWARVLEDGLFELADWTVKLDVDTVFLPNRLRKTLRQYHDAPEGAYLGGNCEALHMYGPIEIFSRNAMHAYQKYGHDNCLHGTEHTDIEDTYMDICMNETLHAERLENFDVLKAPACPPYAGWEKCDDTTASAFHPFKDTETWLDCWRKALSIS